MIFCRTFSSGKGAGGSIACVTNAPSSARVHRPSLVLLALIALWSLLYDSVSVRAHQHAATKIVTAQVQTAGASLDDACGLCTATATLDALLLPMSPDWQRPTAAAIVIPHLNRPAHTPHRRAHDWHSRAPPGLSSPS